jgi:hypothetical protein
MFQQTCLSKHKENTMLELLIVSFFILWLVGDFGPIRFPTIPAQTGGSVYLLLVIMVV